MPEDKNWEKVKKAAKEVAKKWVDMNVGAVKGVYDTYSSIPGSWPDITRRIKNRKKKK